MKKNNEDIPARASRMKNGEPWPVSESHPAASFRDALTEMDPDDLIPRSWQAAAARRGRPFYDSGVGPRELAALNNHIDAIESIKSAEAEARAAQQEQDAPVIGRISVGQAAPETGVDHSEAA